MTNVKITVKANGPYVVKGDIELFDTAGNPFPKPENGYALPLRPVRKQAVLRRDPRKGRVPGGHASSGARQRADGLTLPGALNSASRVLARRKLALPVDLHVRQRELDGRGSRRGR